MELSKFKPSPSPPSAAAPKASAAVDLHFKHLIKPSDLRLMVAKTFFCSLFNLLIGEDGLKEGSRSGFCFWRGCLHDE